MKDKQTELPLDVKFTPPTYNQVQEEAKKTGLPEDEAALFYSFFQSNGWKVGRNRMKSWTDALNTWRLRWLKTQAPGRGRSVWELTKILEAKQKIAEAHKRKYSAEVAGGLHWDDDEMRVEYGNLIREINNLTKRIAAM